MIGPLSVCLLLQAGDPWVETESATAGQPSPPARLDDAPYVSAVPVAVWYEPFSLKAAVYSWEVGGGWGQHIGRDGYMMVGGTIGHLIYRAEPNESFDFSPPTRGGTDLRGHSVALRPDIRLGFTRGRWFPYVGSRAGFAFDRFVATSSPGETQRDNQVRTSIGFSLGLVVITYGRLAVNVEGGLDIGLNDIDFFGKGTTMPWEQAFFFGGRLGLIWRFELERNPLATRRRRRPPRRPR